MYINVTLIYVYFITYFSSIYATFEKYEAKLAKICVCKNIDFYVFYENYIDRSEERRVGKE